MTLFAFLSFGRSSNSVKTLTLSHAMQFISSSFVHKNKPLTPCETRIGCLVKMNIDESKKIQSEYSDQNKLLLISIPRCSIFSRFDLKERLGLD